MNRLSWAAFVLFAISPGMFAQSGTPEGALVELATASDLKTAEKHYPAKMAEALDALSPKDFSRAATILLLKSKLMEAGGAVRASNDGDSLLTFENRGRTITAKVLRRVSDGVTAMLQVGFCEPRAECNGGARVWMNYEEGEWRLAELDELHNGYSIKFDDPEFIEQFRDGDKRTNEMTAIGALRTITTSLIGYASAFSDIGFPEQMSALTGKAGEESSAEHAMLLGPEFANKPCIKNGYRFEYTLVRRGADEGAYTVTATPVEFGKTGSRNFFVDESGVIRSTKEDRLATAEDPAIQ